MANNFKTHKEVVAAAHTLTELKSMPKNEFIKWLEKNPSIYNAFRKFALEAIAQRRKRFSAYMIRERVRWYTNVEYSGEFKVSNNVTPYMSRLLALDMPVLRRIFSKQEVDFDGYGKTWW